ncbi:alpha/beta hydrolase [Paenibacillus sp. FSL K6-1558]|uniref:alpha/beta hydrolase n=1 Tax=Paenibacillus sp. FSL K6-1558 TaxID=2921473 RepID=UPI0012BA0BAB|nr:alpha/beta hydrolase [Paenibacillus xylanexedens]
MKLEILNVPSFWGTEMKQKHYQVHEGNKKLVVLFPGQNYPCHKPTLHFAGTSAIQSGFDLLILEYGYQAARAELDHDDVQRVVEEIHESIKQVVNKYNQIVFISKSLGTIIAGEVHEKLDMPIKHLFLTPIKDTIRYVNKFNGAVIYGTKDQAFSEELASKINEENEIVKIANANHSLETNEVEESIEILKKLVKIYKDFLGQ